MSKHNDILITAERLFDHQGFHSTGIDQIVREAGVTPRTLYRHFSSKEQLILSVLEQRELRFLQRLETMLQHSDDAPFWNLVFAELEDWFMQEGDQGCLFLRALAEYSHKDQEITQCVLRHKQRTLAFLKEQFAKYPEDPFKDQAENLMLIMEGAVALAPVIGGQAAVSHARQLAQHIFSSISHPKTH